VDVKDIENTNMGVGKDIKGSKQDKTFLKITSLLKLYVTHITTTK
jgi:hypothetical protein